MAHELQRIVAGIGLRLVGWVRIRDFGWRVMYGSIGKKCDVFYTVSSCDL